MVGVPALTVDAADSLYRFDIPSELQHWMTQHDAQVPAVFDADGRPMMCSTLHGSNGALDSIAHTVQGRVGVFDPDRCRDSNLRVCFKDGECVPDDCPHVPVDVPSGSIGDLHTPQELLAVAQMPRFRLHRSADRSHCKRRAIAVWRTMRHSNNHARPSAAVARRVPRCIARTSAKRPSPMRKSRRRIARGASIVPRRPSCAFRCPVPRSLGFRNLRCFRTS